MPFASPFPPLDITQVNVLDYLFPSHERPSSTPLWIDTKDNGISLSAAKLLQWVKRLGYGLGELGLKKGDVVMIYSPNHVYLPVAYLGAVAAGYVRETSFCVGLPDLETELTLSLGFQWSKSHIHATW